MTRQRKTTPLVVTVFVISLEKDLHRREVIVRELGGFPGFGAHVLPAVDGATLPDVMCRHLVQDGPWARRKGSIGCFLSHVRAWEHVMQLRDRIAVIVEDDADVQALGSLSSLEIPEDADLIFLNDQMSLATGTAAASPRVLPIADCLGGVTKKGVGAYGYAVTPSGARKLVSACARDLYYGHVDSRLLRYCASERDLALLADDSHAVQFIRRHHHPVHAPMMGLLRGYCVTPPLITHRQAGISRLEVDTASAGPTLPIPGARSD